MKIFITGANGFIGSNLTKALVKLQHDVFATSQNNTNLVILKNDIRFKTCKLENIESLSADIIEFNPDAVVHCAWEGGNSYSDIYDANQFDNVKYSHALLKTLCNLNNIHFIGIGSASEYGTNINVISEEEKENPTTPYSISKFSFKMVSEHYCGTNNIAWSWIRPFYTYGPYDITTRLIPKTIISCLRGDSIELNSCSSIIDYLFIEDFVGGLINIIEKRLEGVYNICSSEQIEIKSIVNSIHELCQSKSKISFNKDLDRKNFPNFICGTNKKLINNTDTWRPKINITDGLIKTIKYYETIYNN